VWTGNIVPINTGHYTFEITDTAGDGLCCNEPWGVIIVCFETTTTTTNSNYYDDAPIRADTRRHANQKAQQQNTIPLAPPPRAAPTMDQRIALIRQKENGAANIVIRTLGCHRSQRVLEQKIAGRVQRHEHAANIICRTLGKHQEFCVLQ
jgi:hypothetical protein